MDLSKLEDNMSDEFTIDIDKALEKAKTTDLYGFVKDEYPDGVESVRKSVENCEQLAGLDRKLMQEIIKGEFTQYETLNSVGRSSKKIFMEYDVEVKKDDT